MGSRGASVSQPRSDAPRAQRVWSPLQVDTGTGAASGSIWKAPSLSQEDGTLLASAATLRELDVFNSGWTQEAGNTAAAGIMTLCESLDIKSVAYDCISWPPESELRRELGLLPDGALALSVTTVSAYVKQLDVEVQKARLTWLSSAEVCAPVEGATPRVCCGSNADDRVCYSGALLTPQCVVMLVARRLGTDSSPLPGQRSTRWRRMRCWLDFAKRAST